MNSARLLLGFVLSTAFALPAMAASYQYRAYVPGISAAVAAPPAQPLTLTLDAASLPAATRGQSYTYDFTSLLAISGDSPPLLRDVAWSSASSLPPGLSLSAAGVLSGTPSVTGATDVQVTASYLAASSPQTYTITVNGQALDVLQVDSGYGHTCALLTNGTVKCWGVNNFGQLGTGNTTASYTPVAVNGLTGSVAKLVVGGWHSCALLTTGTAKCWGRNSHGQLGDNTGSDKATPTTVYGLTGITAMETNDYTTCFIANSAAYCTGANNWYNVGDGTQSNRVKPVAVVGISGTPASIAVGDYHTCVVTTAGAAQCWGYNAYGQLGDTTLTSRTAPTAVAGLSSGVAELSLSMYGSCALLTDGTAKCWGLNDYGQVGDGTQGGNRATPMTVAGLTGLSKIVRGFGTTCAIQGSTVKCWGRGASGSLGNGTTVQQSVNPVTVSNIEAQPVGLSATSNSSNSFCAALASGALKCWGDNAFGQLGDGTTTNRSLPVTPTM